ncbi:MAG TPA: hypothetical protein DCP92_20660 [Nitrospiraceae bacterium]|nr:hypothetical protein [Nitrospiraceae bacterium]
MKSRITAWILLILMVLTPTLAFAQTQQPDTSAPPVSQPLVREGTFAVGLVKALNLSETTNETEAESILTKAGVAPANGWISDYPVTPDVVGDLKASITKATQAGSITTSDANAQNALQTVENYYAMTVAPAPSAAPQGESGSGYYDNTVVDNYYNDEGPPVVTYYTPPPDYSYLYTWVPYPFWWWGWWFGGYYILSGFTFPAYYGYWPGVWYPYHSWYGRGYCYRNWYGRTYWGNHGPWNNASAFRANTTISNHFRDPITHTMGTINPGTHAMNAGTSSRSFSHFATPQAAASARAIYNTTRGSMTSAAHTQGTATWNNHPYTTGAYNHNYALYSRSYTQPSYASHYNTFSGRSQFVGGQRTFNTTHSYATHSFSSSGMRSSSGGSRGFSGGSRGFSGGRR